MERVYRSLTARGADASDARRTLHVFSPAYSGEESVRRATLLGIAAAVVVLALAACSSSGAKQGTATTAATPSAGSTSASTATGHTVSTGPRVTTSTTSGVNPNVAEINPAGDIPDNQVFVKYLALNRTYSLVVPEGWGRTETTGVTTFADHFNSIRVEVKKSPSAPTVATARATEVPGLQRAVSGFSVGNVTSASRAAGPVLLVTYRANSAADAVTGKSVVLDVERYEFWRNGTELTITLSAPQGSDNVDPWKKVTDSFAWSA